jgi:hypothetical protein
VSIRQITSTVTVAGPDAYATPTTFYAGQLLDVVPGGYWDTALGADAPALAGTALTTAQTGTGGLVSN